VLGADPARDVVLGTDVNIATIRGTDLSDRRVVMFATHGLKANDLPGLTQPALALSNPQVAQVDGNGLLTVDDVLGLKLNADWVVLSACNTAAPEGEGAEAVSGLGRAFFYAGTRAVLVTSWAVETTSAAMLTTETFRRVAATPGLGRAEALRQAMLAVMDAPGLKDPASGRIEYSYAHPMFWAPYILVGDGRN
jgi:CHAT domain-containing protein